MPTAQAGQASGLRVGGERRQSCYPQRDATTVTTLRVVTSDGQANEERHNTPRDGTVDDHDEEGDMRRRGARECD